MVVIRRVRRRRRRTCSGRASSRCGRRASGRRPRRSARRAPRARRTTSSRPTASTSSARSAASTRCDIIRAAARRSPTAAGTRRPKNGNTHLYTLVLGSQTLHATGYAMGLAFDGAHGTGDPETRRGRASSTTATAPPARATCTRRWSSPRATRRPQVFFLQNNQWAISVPVATPVAHRRSTLRGAGFGIPSIPIDGNDVLASYAVTRVALDEARAGDGPRAIEALTYRMGAHTTSDDPTKYRTADEERVLGRSATRSRACAPTSRAAGASDAFFADVEAEARGRRRRRAACARSSSDDPPRDADVRPRLQRAASAHRRAARLARRSTRPRFEEGAS